MEDNYDKNLVIFFKKGFKSKYKPGEIIIRADDEPQGVYYLLKGYVKLYTTSIDGKELVFNIFKPQSYFPIAWFLADEKNNYYYEAVNTTTVYRLSKDDVLNFLDNNPESIKLLAKRLSSGIVGLSRFIDILFSGTARQKIIFAIMQLSLRFGEETSNGIVKIKIPVTHQMVSDMAGLARETTSIEMKKMKEERVIDYSRKLLKILDIKKLRILSNEAEIKDEIIL